MKPGITHSKKRPRSGSYDDELPEPLNKEGKKLLNAFSEFDKVLCNLLSAASRTANIQTFIGGERGAFLLRLKTKVDHGKLGWIGGSDDGKGYRTLGDWEGERKTCKKAKLSVKSKAEIEGKDYHKSFAAHKAEAAGNASEGLPEGGGGYSSGDLSNEDEGHSPDNPSENKPCGWPPLLPYINDKKLRRQVFMIKNTEDSLPSFESLNWIGSAWIHLVVARIIVQNTSFEEHQLCRFHRHLLTEKLLAGFAIKYGLGKKTGIMDNRGAANVFRAYVAAVAFTNPHGSLEVLTSWLGKLYQPILSPLRNLIGENVDNARLLEEIHSQLEYIQNTPSALSDKVFQPTEKAIRTITAAKIGFIASVQAVAEGAKKAEKKRVDKAKKAAKLAQIRSDKLDSERAEKAAKAAQLESEALARAKVIQALALAKAKSEKMEKERLEKAAKLAQIRSDKLDSERAEKAAKAAQLESEALARAKVIQALALAKAKSEKMEKERLEKVATFAQIKSETSIPAKALSKRAKKRAAKAAQLKSQSLDLAQAGSENIKRDKVEKATKDAQLRLEALARAESEKIDRRQRKRALKKEKYANQAAGRVQQAAKEDAQLGYESLPLQKLQNQPSKITSGKDKANLIIIGDSDKGEPEEEGIKTVKGVNVIEKIEDFVDGIEATPSVLSAKQELEKLVNQIGAKVIYSRFEDQYAVERGDSDVHVQVILLWRGHQKVVGHAWEMSEEAAGRRATEALLADQSFFQELARIRLAMERNSRKSATPLGRKITSAVAPLPPLGDRSLSSPISSVREGDIPTIASSPIPHKKEVPDSRLAGATTVEAEVSNVEDFSSLSAGEKLSPRLKAMDPILRAPKEELSSVSGTLQSEGTSGQVGPNIFLTEEDSSLDTETLIVEDEILDDAHPTLRVPKQEVSPRSMSLQVEAEALGKPYFVAYSPHQELFMGAGTVQMEAEVPGATDSAACLPLEDLSSASPTFQVDKEICRVRDIAACLQKGDTQSTMEDVVMEDEILNHTDPRFKAPRTPGIVKFRPSGSEEKGF